MSAPRVPAPANGQAHKRVFKALVMANPKACDDLTVYYRAGPETDHLMKTLQGTPVEIEHRQHWSKKAGAAVHRGAVGYVHSAEMDARGRVVATCVLDRTTPWGNKAIARVDDGRFPAVSLQWVTAVVPDGTAKRIVGKDAVELSLVTEPAIRDAKIVSVTEPPAQWQRCVAIGNRIAQHFITPETFASEGKGNIHGLNNLQRTHDNLGIQTSVMAASAAAEMSQASSSSSAAAAAAAAAAASASAPADAPTVPTTAPPAEAGTPGEDEVTALRRGLEEERAARLSATREAAEAQAGRTEALQRLDATKLTDADRETLVHAKAEHASYIKGLEEAIPTAEERFVADYVAAGDAPVAKDKAHRVAMACSKMLVSENRDEREMAEFLLIKCSTSHAQAAATANAQLKSTTAETGVKDARLVELETTCSRLQADVQKMQAREDERMDAVGLRAGVKRFRPEDYAHVPAKSFPVLGAPAAPAHTESPIEKIAAAASAAVPGGAPDAGAGAGADAAGASDDRLYAFEAPRNLGHGFSTMDAGAATGPVLAMLGMWGTQPVTPVRRM